MCDSKKRDMKEVIQWIEIYKRYGLLLSSLLSAFLEPWRVQGFFFTQLRLNYLMETTEGMEFYYHTNCSIHVFVVLRTK